MRALNHADELKRHGSVNMAGTARIDSARMEIGEKDYLKTLAKGLEVILAFDQRESMTLTQVAKQTEISRAAARRHLLTLVHLGYVMVHEDQYRLTPKILDIGRSFLASQNFTEVLTPFLSDLSHELSRPCSAAVLDGEEIVYVLHIGRADFISINLTIGSRLPAFATSVGRVLLAGMADEEIDEFLCEATLTRLTPFTETDPERLKAIILQTRADGYSLVEQELETGLRSLAVPVHGRGGKVVCGFAISRFNEDVSPQQSKSMYLPAMLNTAERISQFAKQANLGAAHTNSIL